MKRRIGERLKTCWAHRLVLGYAGAAAALLCIAGGIWYTPDASTKAACLFLTIGILAMCGAIGTAVEVGRSSIRFYMTSDIAVMQFQELEPDRTYRIYARLQYPGSRVVQSDSDHAQIVIASDGTCSPSGLPNIILYVEDGSTEGRNEFFKTKEGNISAALPAVPLAG